MFNKFTYLFYTLIFTIPLSFVLWFYFYRILKENWKIILLVTVILTIYGFFLWPTGLTWGTWAYNNQKILGLTILGTFFEDITWWLLVSFLLSSFAIVMIRKEKKKEGLFKRN